MGNGMKIIVVIEPEKKKNLVLSLYMLLSFHHGLFSKKILKQWIEAFKLTHTLFIRHLLRQKNPFFSLLLK